MTNLFGEEVGSDDLIPIRGHGESRMQRQRRLEAVRLAKMHRAYGPGPEGVTCKGCRYLEHRLGRFLKCAIYGVTSSDASDWRAKWAACGKFSAR